MEYIFIRLDKISELPTSEFPDISEEQKAWAREEIFWSNMINMFYNPLVKEKGKKAVLGLFKDGGGYFMGAKTWVPFVPPHKAFIYYLCWEQAHLRGNPVTLVHLSESEAIVEIQSIYFALYRNTSHMRQKISFEDYRQIFETIWQDRAMKANWNLKIEYEGDHVIFHFKHQ